VAGRYSKKFTLALLLWACSFVYLFDLSAQFLDLKQPEGRYILAPFLAPNEEYPQDALKAYRKLKEGVYVSVGTERGFIAAASSPNVTHLLLLDRDDGIGIFNKINILLLKMAKDREHYLELRLRPSGPVWDTAAVAAGLSMDERNFLFKYVLEWNKHVSHNSFFDIYHDKPRQFIFPKFKGVNYLHDNELFKKIQKMAKEDKIDVGIVSFNSNEEVQEVVRQLAEANIPLSALDISNAWWRAYMSVIQLDFTLKEFQKIADPDSYFLTTSQNKISGLAKVITRATTTPWNYRATSFAHINSYPTIENYTYWLWNEWIFSTGVRNLEVQDDRREKAGFYNFCRQALRQLQLY
jgi:hypothetical protein